MRGVFRVSHADGQLQRLGANSGKQVARAPNLARCGVFLPCIGDKAFGLKGRKRLVDVRRPDVEAVGDGCWRNGCRGQGFQEAKDSGLAVGQEQGGGQWGKSRITRIGNRNDQPGGQSRTSAPQRLLRTLIVGSFRRSRVRL